MREAGAAGWEGGFFCGERWGRKKRGARPLLSGTGEPPEWLHYLCDHSLQAAALHSLSLISVATGCKKRPFALC